MFTDGIVTFTGNGKIIYCNNEFSKLTGYSSQILIKKNVEEFFKGLSVRKILSEDPQKIYTLTLIKSDSSLLKVSVRLDSFRSGLKNNHIMTILPIYEAEISGTPQTHSSADQENKKILLYKFGIKGTCDYINEEWFKSENISITNKEPEETSAAVLKHAGKRLDELKGSGIPESFRLPLLYGSGREMTVLECMIFPLIKSSGELEGYNVILERRSSPVLIKSETHEQGNFPEYHMILDELSEAVCVMSGRGEIFYGNDAFKTRVLKNSSDFTFSAVCGIKEMRSNDFIPPEDFFKEDLPERTEIFLRVENSKGEAAVYSGNLKILHYNDDKMAILSINAPVEIEHILSLSHQLFPGSTIEGLRQRNLLFNNLLNRIPYGIILFKTGTELIECNIAALRLFEYFNLTGRLTGPEADPYNEIIKRNHDVFDSLGLFGVKLTRSELNKQIEIMTIKGNKKTFSATVLPVNGDHGEEIVKCLILSSDDRIPYTFRESDMGSANLPFAVFNAERDGKITVVNRYFYDLFDGYTYKNVGNISAADLFASKESLDLFFDALHSDVFPVVIPQISLRHSAEETYTLYILRKEEAEFSDSGDFTIIVVPETCPVIQREKLAQMEKLNDMNIVKSGIMKIISFKLREILIGLIGVRDSDEFTDISKLVLSESIGKLISNLKIIEVVNSIQDKVYIPKNEPANLIALCSESAEEFKENAVRKHLNLNFVAYEEHITVVTDIYLLKGILHFITENAIKFTEYGSILIEVKKLKNVTGFSAVISVTDTGHGIPEESKDSIFFRYKDIKTGFIKDYEGLGMGLFIARSFADVLGYKINVESILGKGSKFSIFVR